MAEIAMWGVNALFMVVIWFMRESYVEMKSRVKELEQTTVKKDDFKDFKEELFRRLDKMEAKWTHE